jgi:hypothetical protein
MNPCFYAVLTASSAREYSFEGMPVEGGPPPKSVFTGALVAGLRPAQLT